MGKRYAVIGDLMLDIRVEGEVERISPEAPVPVFRETRRSCSLGGAGNVAANIESLMQKEDAVRLFAVYDRDTPGAWSTIPSCSGVDLAEFCWNRGDTTTKTRFFARGQQLFRVDNEMTHDITAEEVDYLFDRLVAYAPDAIIFADYRKGVCVLSLVRRVIEWATGRGIPVYVDAKPGAVCLYEGATLMKMNRKEYADVVRNARPLPYSRFGALVITQDKGGAVSKQHKGRIVPETHHVATNPNPVDVTGAGDTVLAALAVGITEGMDVHEATEWAMKAAGVAVGKPGTTVVRRWEVE